MPHTERKSSDVPLLQGYSDMVGLGHSAERLAELEPHVVGLLRELSRLWDVDVTDYGLAIEFRVADERLE